MDVIKLVKEGKGIFEWHEVVSEHQGYKLYIKVFRDAMKFDGMPSLTWHREAADTSQLYDGVRLPSSAYEAQQIADLLSAMLLTPKVIDLIWLRADLKFDCITKVNGSIVANTSVTDYHKKLEEAIAKRSEDSEGKLIACVGKYWCLSRRLESPGGLLYHEDTACNYGWFAEKAPSKSVTGLAKIWQTEGCRHDKTHLDPSQLIRLMHRKARLISPDGSEKEVDLHDIAIDPKLCWLINHNGFLHYLRQAHVPVLEPLKKEEQALIEPQPEPEPEPQPVVQPEDDVTESETTQDDIDTDNSTNVAPPPEKKSGIILILFNLLKRLFSSENLIK